MKTLDRLKFVIGLVLLFGGLDLTILLSHTNRLVGVGLIFAGLAFILWAAKSSESEAPEKIKKPENLASKVVHLLTLNGRFRDSIPIAGIGVLVSVIAFNFLLADEFRLGSNDYVGLLLAGILISYYQIPKKYSVERDFALLFSIFLFVFLVIPTTLLQLTSEGGTVDTNSPLTYYFLAAPTAALSNLLGIPVISPFMNGAIPVYHIMQVPGPDGFDLNLSISLSCSGLYSVAIFVSAFIAFVAVEYKKFDQKVAILLGIGIILAWIANILRMTIIVIVGHYNGMDAMLWTHNNIGELIFMAWVILFWVFMFRYFGVLESKEPVAEEPAKKQRGKCAICEEPLSRTIPSRRCECGAISHAGCILTNEHRCPSCGVEFDPTEKQ
ncbi:MAG: archaeosortase/exosortase family protein [Thermoplasmata archaeon]|nr:archaeosortase/exosortase family protein [Thermoplasmata archaeon]